MYKLINYINLLPDEKSFDLGVYDTRSSMWILMHLRKYKIKNKKIYYKKNTGYRQRKKTNYPVRSMIKKFKNTPNLLAYLDSKQYDIHYFEIEFTNGWRIKEKPHVEIRFETNSKEDRDYLIDKLMKISGQN